MRWSTAAGVGVVVVVAVAILVSAFVLLESAGVIGNTYPLVVEFDNAQGITKGTDVRLAGVKIGEVEQVALSSGNRAQLKLRISQRYTVPSDAEIRLSSSGLFTPPVVEIVPPRRGPVAKGVRKGTVAPTFEELLPPAKQLLANLTDLTNSMHDVIGDRHMRQDLKLTTANLRQTTANFAQISERGKRIANNLESASTTGRQIATRFQGTTEHIDQTAQHFNQSAQMLKNTLAENRAKVGQMVTSANAALVSVKDTMSAVQGLVQHASDMVGDPKLKSSLQGSLANVEQTTAHLEKLSSNLEQLSSDPKLNEDLRATVAGTRAAVEQLQLLIQRMNRIVGTNEKSVSHVKDTIQRVQESVSKTEVAVDAAQQTSPGRPRVDLNAYVPSGTQRFYRLGLYDVSEGNKLNLQIGQSIGRASLRFGTYAGHLGLGLDVGRPSHPRFSADLYGLDTPLLDLNGRAPIRSDLDLNFGVQKVFNRNAPSFGVTWWR
jgi:phospholipid/cholesterol/gamma-HCH transport system substrate-binding protein